LNLAPIFGAHPYAKVILETLRRRGHDAALVGGVVRDALRAQQAKQRDFVAREVDLASDASPQQVRRLFSGWKTLEVGKAFGVIVLLAPDGRRYELASYRGESDYDGRRPARVRLVRSLERDLKRRDFTVNGLAARLDGAVVDVVGGVADLEAGVIRTIGDPQRRFWEDGLRLLRAVRFACALGARIEPRTARALAQNSRRLERVSAERVRDEFFKVLATPRAKRGIELLERFGVLALFLPELCALKGVPQPPQYHPEGDVWTHTLLALGWADRLRLDPLLKLAVLLHDVGKPEALRCNEGRHAGGHEHVGRQIVVTVGERLKLSASERNALALTTEEHMRVARLPQMHLAKQLRFVTSGTTPHAPDGSLPRHFPRWAALLSVLLCDAQASVHRASAWLPVLQQTVAVGLRLHDLAQLERAHKLLDGNDVLRLGLNPGPAVGRVLEAVYDRVFSGEIHDREHALEAARRWIERHGLDAG